MGEPFLAEVKIVSFNFAPRGWAFCNGQLLPINQNQALFSLLGTTYGGDGRTTFALPDLRGRTPIHTGVMHNLGERGGETAHTLSQSELPTHVHMISGTTAMPNSISASGAVTGRPRASIYRAPDGLTALTPATVTSVGGSQPHNNLQPYLVLNFCIALQGIFPSRN